MIKLVRLDYRLLHGQVVFSWTGHVGAQRIIVVDDDAANDEMKKSALLLSQVNDYNNWKTRRTLGICAGDVWYYTVHLGWWKDEVEPFAPQWEKLSKAAGAKKTAFLLGDFNSEADVRGEGYDLVLGSGWQDTYRLAQQRDAGYTVVEAIDGWRDAPDAAAKKRIDQIWCSKAVAVKSSRVVFSGLQEPQVSDHAGVLIEL